jgi:sulfite exporter TauE/SafE
MLCFGLGTLPMLFVMGTTAQWLMQFSRRLLVRRTIGALIILFGIATLSEIITFHPNIEGIEVCD